MLLPGRQRRFGKGPKRDETLKTTDVAALSTLTQPTDTTKNLPTNLRGGGGFVSCVLVVCAVRAVLGWKIRKHPVKHRTSRFHPSLIHHTHTTTPSHNILSTPLSPQQRRATQGPQMRSYLQWLPRTGYERGLVCLPAWLCSAHRVQGKKCLVLDLDETLVHSVRIFWKR